MRKGIVALVLTLAFAGLISAASAAVITGTQTYSYTDDAEGFFTGFSSGSTQDLTIAGATVATANVNNYQDLWVVPADPVLENPVVAQQYGATKLTLNNYQEPGNLMNTIKDVQFESKQGGLVEFMSEGVDYADSYMGGTASASTVDANNILIHAVDIVDQNSGYAGASTYNSEIKHGVFNWDAVSAANIVFQDSMTEHADVASGMSVGAYAEGKILPGADYGEISTYGEFWQTGVVVIDNAWY
jgi:hypothetical protein